MYKYNVGDIIEYFDGVEDDESMYLLILTTDEGKYYYMDLLDGSVNYGYAKYLDGSLAWKAVA
jgi:hypothetical protein